MIIDISQFNTIVNWSLIKDNVEGVICRIGYRGHGSGKIVLDKKFKEYSAMCIKLNIPLGGYFVTQATTEKEAEEEAIFAVENSDGFTIGIWCDNEFCDLKNHKGRADTISKAQRTTVINAFSSILTDNGIKNGLYCSDSWFNDMLVKKDLAIPLYWVAKYGKNNGNIPNDRPSHLYHYWQYTSVGKVPGVKGNCDCSIANNSIQKIPSLRGYKGFQIEKGLYEFGYDGSFENRKKIANEIGIKNYRGTADQNLYMLNSLKNI